MVVYLLTYYEALFLRQILPGPLKSLAFGILFLWGMLNSIMVRAILTKMGLSRYIDNTLQRRVTGTPVDFMVVATLMAVQVSTIWTYIVPFVLMCLTSGGFTVVFLIWMGRHSGDYSFDWS